MIIIQAPYAVTPCWFEPVRRLHDTHCLDVLPEDLYDQRAMVSGRNDGQAFKADSIASLSEISPDDTSGEKRTTNTGNSTPSHFHNLSSADGPTIL